MTFDEYLIELKKKVEGPSEEIARLNEQIRDLQLTLLNESLTYEQTEQVLLSIIDLQRRKKRLMN